MSKVVAVTNITLDGVMQAPGRPDEDRRDGFDRGGWATPYGAMLEAGESFANAGALLFGRRTYEDFHRVWPARTGNPFTAWLDGVQKHVASRTLTAPLPWQNSTLLQGDAADAVIRLKSEPGKDLLILGSGDLIGALTARRVIDEYVLLIHPLVLGSGRRLFDRGGALVDLRLVNSKATARGVVIATYQLADATQQTA